jgi:predicted secreted protein
VAWVSIGVVFVIIWWLVLFMVLPFGAQPPDVVEPGHADSAPARPRILIKLLITTGIAVLLTGLVVMIIEQGWIRLAPA